MLIELVPDAAPAALKLKACVVAKFANPEMEIACPLADESRLLLSTLTNP